MNEALFIQAVKLIGYKHGVEVEIDFDNGRIVVEDQEDGSPFDTELIQFLDEKFLGKSTE